MASPYSSGPTTSVNTTSGQTEIDALITDERWGSIGSTTTYLTYSFPWKSSSTATFRNYYSYEDEPSSGFALNSTQQAAAVSSFTAWANVAKIVFSEVAETSINVGEIRVAFSSIYEIRDYWGWARTPGSHTSSGDIWINLEFAYDSWSQGSYNYLSILHEIGHALGLKHPHEDGVVMPSNLDNSLYTLMSYEHQLNYVYPETPMVLDILAIQYMYGANYSYNAGDNTYTFDTGRAFLKTIWDGGGTDTLNLEAHYGNTEINLTPGSYSKLSEDGSKQFGIAYNCVIENAIGSQGSDHIQGNSADNYLDGGGSSDTLKGAAGNDYFDWNPNYRGGDDIFYGGTGNDIYVVWGNDSIIEYENEGTDTVWVTTSYSLENLSNIENIGAYGSTAVNLTGNSLANLIFGSNANDVLDGKGGIDKVVFTDVHADCTITANSGGYLITTKTNGSDQLTNIEYASFGDKTILLSTLSSTSSEGSSSGGSSSGGSSSNSNYWGWVEVGDLIAENQSVSLYVSSGGTLYFLADSGLDSGAADVDPLVFKKANGKAFNFKIAPSNFIEKDDETISIFSKNAKGKWSELTFDSDTGHLIGTQIKHTLNSLLLVEEEYQFDIDNDGSIGTSGGGSSSSKTRLENTHVESNDYSDNCLNSTMSAETDVTLIGQCLFDDSLLLSYCT